MIGAPGSPARRSPARSDPARWSACCEAIANVPTAAAGGRPTLRGRRPGARRAGCARPEGTNAAPATCAARGRRERIMQRPAAGAEQVRARLPGRVHGRRPVGADAEHGTPPCGRPLGGVPWKPAVFVDGSSTTSAACRGSARRAGPAPRSPSTPTGSCARSCSRSSPGRARRTPSGTRSSGSIRSATCPASTTSAGCTRPSRRWSSRARSRTRRSPAWERRLGGGRADAAHGRRPAGAAACCGRCAGGRSSRPPTPVRLGDRVRVRRIRPAGHTRCPRYLRGARGTIARVQGLDGVPDVDNAGDRAGVRRRIRQRGAVGRRCRAPRRPRRPVGTLPGA